MKWADKAEETARGSHLVFLGSTQPYLTVKELGGAE
jgi:hypothetical protein